MQYGESDLDFISRLCEEEGIYFYFEHSESSHCLCFCDREGGPKIAGESALRFYPGSGHVADSAVISRIRMHQMVNSNASAYREWNFTRPRLDLGVKEKETDTVKAPVPQGMLLEQYRYPHLYELRAPGDKYVKLQVLRQLTFRRWIEAEADVCRFLPSYVFTIKEHPRPDANAQWWVVRVQHNGEQPGVLEHEAPSGRGLRYASQVVAIPAMTRFVPVVQHAKRRVVGAQSAIVTGPKGEEIYPDKYGRVKVQFHWDREGKQDENTTCWIRASQGWAGSTFGTEAVPRIGQEVIVNFLEGDPDRPLITGRVYHELNRVPYELPAHKTRTVFKSTSTPGKEGEPRGFNELRIEDKKSEEEIYAHAEKDVNIHVKNDWKEHILRDFHATTDRHTYTLTKGETHETLTKPRKTELHANDNLTVHADKHVAVDGKWLGKAGVEIHLKSGVKIVMEAGAELTLKAGGSWLTLSPAGISADGPRVGLNSGGSAGKGTGAEPELPDEVLLPSEGVKINAKSASTLPPMVADPYAEKTPELTVIPLLAPDPRCDYLYNSGNSVLDMDDSAFKNYKTQTRSSCWREEEGYSFPGASESQKAIHWKENVHGHDINVVLGTDFGGNKSQNMLVVQEVSQVIKTSLSSLPKPLATKIDTLIVSPFKYPESLKQSPDDIYYATTIDDKITIYRDGLSDTTPSTLIHEAAHAFENSLPNNGEDFLKEWGAAIAEDKRSLNEYSKENNSEDFSESTVAYFASKNTQCEDVFKKLYPSRYAILETIYTK